MNDDTLIKCASCRGTGRIWFHGENLASLGIGYLFGKEACPACQSVGYVTVKSLRARIAKLGGKK